MTNALKARASAEPISIVRRSEEEMREWCWEKNQQCREAKFAHWLSVSKDKESGSFICRARSGADAMDVIDLLNGKRPDYVGWDEERLDNEFRILRHIARMGMPETEWQTRFARKLGGN